MHELILTLTDEQMTRLLDIQDNDKESQGDAVSHIFALGLSARENSIKATRKRKDAEKAADAQNALAKLIALDPTILTDASKLSGIMQKLGIVPAVPAA